MTTPPNNHRAYYTDGEFTDFFRRNGIRVEFAHVAGNMRRFCADYHAMELPMDLVAEECLGLVRDRLAEFDARTSAPRVALEGGAL